MFSYIISVEEMNKKGCKSMYEYLYMCIRDDILEGKLAANTRLPSKREFAREYKISLKTVENTYEQLLMEGYIYSVEKSGYFVEEIETGKLRNSNFLYDDFGIEERADFGYENVSVKMKSDMNIDDEKIDLTSNKAAIEHFPYSTWVKIMREVLVNREKELLSPVPFAGVYELRVEIAKYLYEYKGMRVSPNQIIVGAGTEYLYGRLIQLLGKDCVYGVEDPGYHRITKLYEVNGVGWKYIGIDEDGLKVEELELSENSKVNVIHVSPGHHFPTGTIMPVGRRKLLLDWAKKERDRYIIEDDFDSEFRFSKRPIPAIQSMDVNHRVIYFNTFSKTLAPSIRISYMVLPPKLMDRYISTMNFYACTVSAFEQYAMAEFMKNGYFQRHIYRMKKYYKNQRNEILKVLKESQLYLKMQVEEKDAGNHFLIKLDTQLSDTQLKWFAKERGIVLDCLSEYCELDKDRYQHCVIVNYSDLSGAKMKIALEKLEAEFV